MTREPDFEKRTMPEILTRTAERFPAAAALSFMGRKISFKVLEAQVNRFARALAATGVAAGDKVSVLLPNMPQSVIATYAILKIGAVAVMNNPLAAEEELAFQLGDSEATTLVTLDLRLPLVSDLKKKTAVRSIIACHVTDYLPFPGNKLLRYLQPGLYRKIEPEAQDFLLLLAKYSDAPVESRARWDDLGALLYTAGTMGASRGVMLTHGNISCAAQQFRAWLPELRDGAESILAVFPFFHAAGWTAVQHLSILAGWTDILVPHPEPPAVLEIMGKRCPTLLPGSPAVFGSLLENEKFRRTGFSSVKAFLAGMAPLTRKVRDGLQSLGPRPVLNLYGLAETGFAGTAGLWNGPGKPGTVGLPLPGTRLRIVDPETGTRDLPAGEAGEVCFQGPQVMQGYYKKPEKSAEVLREGWLFSGDMGFLDQEGYLTLLGRKKDRIMTQGGAVYPWDIERILMAHPKVADACAVGLPAGPSTEVVKAWLVLKPGEKADAEELIAHCRGLLSPDQIPQGIAFIDRLPRNDAGEVRREKVRELAGKSR